MSWVPERKRTRDLHAFDGQVDDLARGFNRMRLPGPEYATAARPRPPPPSPVDLAIALADFVEFWKSQLPRALSLRWHINSEYGPSVVVVYQPSGERAKHLVTIQFADHALALRTREPLFRVQTTDARHNWPLTAAQVLDLIHEEYVAASSY